jgi:A/G-specific adenine glycosylase
MYLASENPDLGRTFIDWYLANKRDLPWRNTTNPYAIWLSEIILQQTRVAQGLPYYEKFLAAYPTVMDLAAAPQEEVLRLWQGLGYYSRARNLHNTAKIIVSEHGGDFPDNYKELLTLKGIGPYTAAAIASFAYNEDVAVVDGNVFRVLARLMGNRTDIASTEGKKVFTAIANELLTVGQANVFNQAIMEFGAIHCTPQKPNCLFCPFASICEANAQSLQTVLPIKIKKLTIKHRFLNYIVFIQNNKVLMKKRTAGDIWEGLHDFYLIETETATNFEDLKDDLLQEALEKGIVLQHLEVFKHILTHQRLEANFTLIQLPTDFSLHLQNLYLWCDEEKLELVAKPILIVNYLKKNNIKRNFTELPIKA